MRAKQVIEALEKEKTVILVNTVFSITIQKDYSGYYFKEFDKVVEELEFKGYLQGLNLDYYSIVIEPSYTHCIINTTDIVENQNTNS